MSEDRQERSDRLKQRFDRDRDANEDNDGNDESEEGTATASDGSENDESLPTGDNPIVDDQPDESKTPVKDRPSVLMYLPEDLHTELDIRFDELNARYKREHDQPLEKNRDYYPAVIKASLEGKDVKDILDI
ncbi:hypothetical protein ACTG0T_14930 (plasmid) [Halococcus morrhuae DSM 1307]|nr:hypothetical protein [Halococcus morrhuae]